MDALERLESCAGLIDDLLWVKASDIRAVCRELRAAREAVRFEIHSPLTGQSDGVERMYRAMKEAQNGE